MADYIEFFTPNFIDNSTNAKYRKSISTKTLLLKLENKRYFRKSLEHHITVPKELKALNIMGQWIQHPILYLSYQDPDAYARKEGKMIFILADNNVSRIQFQAESYHRMLDIYKECDQLGLTGGHLLNIKPFPKYNENNRY